MAETMAQTSRLYEAPPITEAVIEIRFADRLSFRELQALSRKLARDYPKETVEAVRSANINFAAKEVSFVDEAQQIRRSTNEQVDIAMLKPDAFSFSRLAPYTGWEEFQRRVLRDLTALLSGFRRTIERIGVRYINRIDVPVEGDRTYHVQYFNVFIAVPPEFQGLSTYNLSFETDFAEHKLVVHAGRVEAPVPNTCAFVLDIDVLALKDVPQAIGGIEDRLARMRAVKNTVFESLITPQTRELFQHA